MSDNVEKRFEIDIHTFMHKLLLKSVSVPAVSDARNRWCGASQFRLEIALFSKRLQFSGKA